MREDLAARGRDEVPGLVPFFRFRFAAGGIPSTEANEVQIFVEPLDEGSRTETWFTTGPVRTETEKGIVCVEAPNHFFAHLATELAPEPDVEGAAREAYSRMLDLVSRRGYPRLIRAWSFLPGINEGEGDRERYKRFSVGRSIAFEESGRPAEALPAGTAIGTGPRTPLTISLLATRCASRALENPRQISAYAYPKQYGPRGPSFSRAVIVGSAPGGGRLLVSGTASIVGSESRHPGDPRRQVAETMRNIRVLAEQSAETGAASLRVYVRRVEDLPDVRDELASLVRADCETIYVQGDICRRELLVEIEGNFAA